MSRRFGAVVAAAMVALAGCDATVKSETSKATTVSLTPQPTLEVTGEKPQGRFYAVVGDESGQDGQLYELRFSPPGLGLLAAAKRVSSVGACSGHIAVAAGQQEVGYTDHLQELRDGQLVPLDGRGPIQAFSPRLAGDCRVAYTVVDRAAAPLVGELRIWDPNSKTGKTLYRGKPGDGPLATTDWGPGGAAAVVRLRADQAGAVTPGNAAHPPAVVVARPDGTTSEVALSGDPGLFTWGDRWMAVMDEAQQATMFIDPATNQRQVLRDWRPVVWSPDGERLLVKDAKSRMTLALVDASNPTSVKEIGRLSRPLLDADWLPE